MAKKIYAVSPKKIYGVTQAKAYGVDLSTAVAATNMLVYTASSWVEWTYNALVTAGAAGMEFTIGDAWCSATIPAGLSVNTNYGILYEIVSNSLSTLGLMTNSDLFTSAWFKLVDVSQAAGYHKLTKTSKSSITTNVFRILQSGSGSDGTKAKIKDIRIFELPVGSQIATDFANDTAATLNTKYPF